MKKKKNVFILFLVVLCLLILAFLAIFVLKLPPKSPTPQRPVPSEAILPPKTTSFSGKVIDRGGDFLIISKGRDEKIRVILTPEVEVYKIIYPKEQGERFTTLRMKISPEEIKKGDTLFIKTKERGETIFHVEYIEVL